MASATAAAKDGVSIAWSWHSMIHLFRNFGGHRAPRGRPWLRCYPKVKGSRCSIHLAARPHANVPFKSHAFETKMCLKNTITGDTPHIPKFGSWQLSCSKRDQVLEEMRRTEALHSVRFKKKIRASYETLEIDVSGGTGVSFRLCSHLWISGWDLKGLEALSKSKISGRISGFRFSFSQEKMVLGDPWKPQLMYNCWYTPNFMLVYNVEWLTRRNHGDTQSQIE